MYQPPRFGGRARYLQGVMRTGPPWAEYEDETMPRIRPTSTSVARAVRAASAAPAATSGGAQMPLLAALLAYAAAYAALTLLQPFGAFPSTALADVGGIIPPALAGVFALLAGRRAQRQVAMAWRLIGVGCLSWAFGEAVWTVYEVGLRVEAPFPSFADAGYLAMLPLVALGFIFLSSEEHKLARSRPALDGLAVILACAGFVWLFVIHPTYAASDASVLEKVIGAAYPVGDLVLLYALAVAVERQLGFRESSVLLAMFVGVLLLIASDVGFAFLTLRDEYTATSLVNIGWPFGFLVLAYAAALSASWSLSFVERPSIDMWYESRDILPLLLLPAMVVVDGIAILKEPATITIPLVALTGAAAIAVLLRMVIGWGVERGADQSRQLLVALFEDRGFRHAA